MQEKMYEEPPVTVTLHIILCKIKVSNCNVSHTRALEIRAFHSLWHERKSANKTITTSGSYCKYKILRSDGSVMKA